MFAIPFNFPFRKSNGDISTIGAEIGAGGGGDGYVLPTASANTKGGVKIGEGLTMVGEVLKNDNPTPTPPYSLPTASADTLGGVKIGSGISIDENGVISTSGGGGSVYNHNIYMKVSNDSCILSLVTSSNTPFTLQSFFDFLESKNLLDVFIPCFGVGSSASNLYVKVKVTKSGDTYSVTYRGYNGSTGSNTVGELSSLDDTVI